MSLTPEEIAERYTPLRAWTAEGGRVGLSVCRRCGATLLIDPDIEFDILARHEAMAHAIVPST